MLKLNNMRIGQRLGMGFGLLIVMMLSIVAVALLRFNDVSAINNRIIEKDWVKADAANIVNATTRANARLSMQLLITEDTTQITRIQADINTNKKSDLGCPEHLGPTGLLATGAPTAGATQTSA
jgi:methyl-accepting chemotaxis protein